MVEIENQNDPPTVPSDDIPTTSQQSSSGETSAADTPELEDIMVKWRKAMKTACEAQKLLQEVMDEMARQMRTNNGKGKSHKMGGKMKYKRLGQRCRTHRGAPSSGEEAIEIDSDSNSDSSSDSSDDNDVEIVTGDDGPPNHQHHGHRNRSHSRSRSPPDHSRGGWGRCRAFSATRHHPHFHHLPQLPHFQHPHFHHHPHHPHFRHHHPHHPHQHPHHHPHQHPHHHPHHYPYHQLHGNPGYPGFYDYARNQNEGRSSIHTIVDTLPLALTL